MADWTRNGTPEQAIVEDHQFYKESRCLVDHEPRQACQTTKTTNYAALLRHGRKRPPLTPSIRC
jgi:hypothetical protein